VVERSDLVRSLIVLHLTGLLAGLATDALRLIEEDAVDRQLTLLSPGTGPPLKSPLPLVGGGCSIFLMRVTKA
jgi:hypothetical protein